MRVVLEGWRHAVFKVRSWEFPRLGLRLESLPLLAYESLKSGNSDQTHFLPRPGKHGSFAAFRQKRSGGNYRLSLI